MFDLVSLGEPMYEFSQVLARNGAGCRVSAATLECRHRCARQGARVAYVTRLGDDAFGRDFLELWRREGVDAAGVGIDPEAHTAVYFINHGPQGHVFSYLRAGSAASRMQPAHLPLELIRTARFFHASGISQAISACACDAFAAIERRARCAAYDTNLRLRRGRRTRAPCRRVHRAVRCPVHQRRGGSSCARPLRMRS
jgi:2-dehydro-3-deoxygluconokinase